MEKRKMKVTVVMVGGVRARGGETSQASGGGPV